MSGADLSFRDDGSRLPLPCAVGATKIFQDSSEAWARLTTLEAIDTNRRYFLDFFIDIDTSGDESSGDPAGIQHFEVMPNAVWSETKYFVSELEIVQY